MSESLRIVLAALAVYRLSELVAFDEGPVRIFERLRIKLGALDYDETGRPAKALGRFIACPFCLGCWFAAFVALAVLFPTTAGDAILIWLGLAGAQARLAGSRS